MRLETSALAALTLLLCVNAHLHGNGLHMHSTRGLPDLSRRQSNSRIKSLFDRAIIAQAANYPAQDVVGPAPRSEWVAAYQVIHAAGLIPNIINSTAVNGAVVYPLTLNTSDPSICSYSVSQCTAASDFINAPDGMIGISFDDGPQAPSGEMYAFLAKNNVPSTHFVIGSRILEFPALFQQIITIGGHLAVHTWSHPLMSSLTDLQIVGELGWTMQVIYDQSGYLPQFWRPPYGDVDNRVRAIAREVFGLYTVIWNQDSNDWCLADDGTNSCAAANTGPKTDAGLAKELAGWINGPKAPGLIILEHEHHNRSISGFINAAYPLIIKQGWLYRNIPGLYNMNWYQNAADNTVTPTSMEIGTFALASASASVAANSGLLNSAFSGVTQAASGPAPKQTAVTAKDGTKTVAGWSTLTQGARDGIIGGAAGLAVLLLGLLVYCCRRRRSSNDRHAPSPKRAVPHPFQQFSESTTTLDMKSAQLPSISFTPVVPSQQQPSPPLTGLLQVPARPALVSRASAVSTYSQEGEPPARTVSGAFHLPTRSRAGPYGEEDHKDEQGLYWI